MKISDSPNDRNTVWCFANWSLAVILSLTVYFFHPATDLLSPDSYSYLTFHPSRTIGYPVFLWAAQKLSGGLDYVPVIQLGFFTYACGFLCQRLGWWGIIAAPLLMFQPYVMQSHFQVLTESLSLTLILLIIGVWIDLLQNKRRADMAKLSLLIGVAILIRPSAYALLALLGFAVVKRRLFMQAAAPLMFLLFLGSFGSYVNHGFWGTQSFLGINLIGKTIFAMRDSAITPEFEKYQQLLKAVKPIQDYVRDAPTLEAKTILSFFYYDAVRYFVLPKIFYEDKDWNSIWTQIAIGVIRDNPVAYLKDVSMNYMTLWVYPITSKQSTDFKKYVESTTPPAFDHYKFNFSIQTHHLWFLMLLHVFLAFSFVLSLYFLIRFRTYPLEAGISIMIHAYYLLIACLQAGIVRYAVIAWPCIILLNVFFLKDLVGRFSRVQTQSTVPN